jgi:hypothetical protein
VTREEIIELVREMGEKLGRAPSQREMRETGKVTWYQIYKHFRGMRQAVRAAGLEPGPKGGPLNEQAMLMDWGGVVRKLGRLPYRVEYDRMGRHSATTLHSRLKWNQLAHRFVVMTREFHVQAEWKDVVEIIVKAFPLLGRQQLANSNWQVARGTQHSALSIQPLDGIRGASNQEETGREWTRTGAKENLRHRSTLMDTDQRKPLHMGVYERREAMTTRAAAVNEAAMRAMGLGKVIAWAVALEMLMAKNGTQQLAVSIQESTQQSACSIQPLDGSGDRGIGTSDHREIGKPELPELKNRPSPEFTAEDAERVEAAGEKFLSAHHLGGREWIDLRLPSRVPVYGQPLHLAAMAHAPTNEGGVLFLFGVLAESLGYRIERIQAAFPDCEAKRQIRPGVWERVRIEFEFESRGFREHRHDVTGCDVIVCWRHNWLECPEGIEVVELEKVIEKLG